MAEKNTTPAPLPRGYNPAATRLMWTGVIIISVVIVGFWGWSLKLQMGAINWSQSKESVFMHKTKTDWDNAFAETEEKETAAEQIKTAMSALASAKAAALAATTTSSTTASSTNTVSSTIETTSTVMFPTSSPVKR